MKKTSLLLQSGLWAFFIGGIFALYISISTFLQLPYDLWLTIHNLLFVASLMLSAFVGYCNRVFGFSFRWMLLTISVFFAVNMFLYISSYAMTTALLADKMVWIPFFYSDYNYHGFESVVAYLKYENHYLELLKLQLFSFLISSVMYFLAGSLGYGVRAFIN